PTVYVLFFFQAEDGIRDFHVTGVQTCALPIYLDRGFSRKEPGGRPASYVLRSPRHPRRQGRIRGAGQARAREPKDRGAWDADLQIGRASCRESGLSAEGAGPTTAEVRGVSEPP